MNRLANAPIALEATVLLAWATVGVKVLSASRLVRLLGTVDQAATPTGDVGGRARRVGWTVERVAPLLPWRPVCLPQAIATRAMLRRRGIDATLHLGVVTAGPMTAHAWVSVGAKVIQGAPVGAATEVARFR